MGNLQYNLKKRKFLQSKEKLPIRLPIVTFSVSKCQNGKGKRKKIKHSKFTQTFLYLQICNFNFTSREFCSEASFSRTTSRNSSSN